jgi:hypothetical protein
MCDRELRIINLFLYNQYLVICKFSLNVLLYPNKHHGLPITEIR